MPKKILLLLFILYLNIFSQSYNIDLVKYGKFNNYPNVNINEIVNTIFDNVIWEDIEGVDGNRYVNMITDTPSQKFIMQFRILNNNRWYINAAELNDEPYNISNIEEELYNLYQEYTGKQNQNNYNQNLNLSDSQFISLVKDNYFSSHKDVKVGDIMAAIFDNVKWEKIIGSDGNNYVNMNAYSDNEKITIQFKIIDLYSWELNALEIEGIAYSTENIDDKLYDLYKRNKDNYYYNDNYYNNYNNNQNNNNYYKPNNNQNFNNNNLNNNNNNNNFNNTPDIKNNNLSYRVNIVRNNYFLPHRDATIGEIIDTVFSKLGYDVKWEDNNNYVTVNISSVNNKWKSVLKFQIENNNSKLIDAKINGEKYNIETIKNDLYSSYIETKKQYGQLIKD